MSFSPGTVSRLIFLGIALAGASCQGGSRGWKSQQGSTATAEDLVAKWKTGRGTPPRALSGAEIESLVPLLSTSKGLSTAEYLAAATNAQESVLPVVHKLFIDSLASRFTDEDRRDPGDHPPLQELRDSCLSFFQILGPKAEVAGPDLLELLRRREAEHEFVGSSSGRFFGNVLRSVLINRTDLVVGASKSEVAGVRVEAYRIMGDMRAQRSTYGPVLTDALLDSDDQVVHASIQSLGLLEWRTPQTIERLRERIKALQTEWMREPWTIALHGMERAIAGKK